MSGFGLRQRDDGRLPGPVTSSDPIRVDPRERPAPWALKVFWACLAIVVAVILAVLAMRLLA